jgi:hypothetical protein
MTAGGDDERASGLCLLVDGTRTVGEVFEEFPDAAMIVRLRPSSDAIGGLGHSEPDAVFDVEDLRSHASHLPLEELPAPRALKRLVSDDEGRLSFENARWRVNVETNELTIVRLGHYFLEYPRPGGDGTIGMVGGGEPILRRRLPGPPLPGEISVSCTTCRCRTTVKGKIPRTCPCGNPPPGHPLAYGP